MTVFLDTNVLAYLYDETAEEKRRVAAEVLENHAADAVISTQVLIELHAVLTRIGLSREHAARVLDAIDIDVVTADEHLVRRAATTAAEHQLSIFDALILEAAVSSGCEELWTEDLAAGSTLRGVRIVNPFAGIA
ncbi:MAG: PIN domain-containing protein [Gordonia sp. (in: high G+C Gram-positive bacteria)]|uniref:PIN domain-containing protein n=1 Tax=Gordonia sp. (in: high G+C Gram-positive bacteria) TaxID=84139 RepID=UPI0039E24FBC